MIHHWVEEVETMAISPAHARSMMGRWVEARSVYGVHRGILHEVRQDGIVLAMPRGPVGFVSGQDNELRLNHADKGVIQDVEHVQFFRRRFFNPFFFFFPFFTLFALSPFFFF